MQLWDHILWAINLTIHNLRWYGTYVSQKQWDNVNNIPNSVPGTELISSQEQLLYEQTISMYWKCVKSSKHPLELLLQTHWYTDCLNVQPHTWTICSLHLLSILKTTGSGWKTMNSQEQGSWHVPELIHATWTQRPVLSLSSSSFTFERHGR